MASFSTRMPAPLGYTMVPYTPQIQSRLAERLYGLRGDLEDLQREEASSLSWGTWTAISLVVLSAILVNNALLTRGR
jgi:hypothetical protein